MPEHAKRQHFQALRAREMAEDWLMMFAVVVISESKASLGNVFLLSPRTLAQRGTRVVKRGRGKKSTAQFVRSDIIDRLGDFQEHEVRARARSGRRHFWWLGESAEPSSTPDA